MGNRAHVHSEGWQVDSGCERDVVYTDVKI